jgi:hypothetical protein
MSKYDFDGRHRPGSEGWEDEPNEIDEYVEDLKENFGKPKSDGCAGAFFLVVIPQLYMWGIGWY